MQSASTHGESAHQDQHVRMMEDMSAETRRHGVETALNLPREQALSHAASFVVLLVLLCVRPRAKCVSVCAERAVLERAVVRLRWLLRGAGPGRRSVKP